MSLGAQPANRRGGTVLKERACWRNVLFETECQCEARLRLDHPEARYRRNTRTGQLSEMCDYAIVGLRANLFYIRVLELKGGSAEREAINQIRAGLIILDRFLPSGIKYNVRAYALANRNTGRFKPIAVNSKLRFRTTPVRLQVEKCGGDTLYV